MAKTNFSRIPNCFISLRVLLLVCCLLAVRQGAAQSMHFVHFGLEEGLSSLETYAVYQDSANYVWIASDQGVNRYNGQSFERFTTADGLSDNTVFLIVPDSCGRIWFITHNSQLCYHQNNRFVAFSENEALSKTLPAGSGKSSVTVIRDSVLALNIRNSTPQFITANGIKMQAPDTSQSSKHRVFQMPDGSPLIFQAKHQGRKKKALRIKGWTLSEELKKTDLILDTTISNAALGPGGYLLFECEMSELFFSRGNNLFHIAPGQKRLELRATFPFSIESVHKNRRNGKLWVGTRKGMYVEQDDGSWKLEIAKHYITDIYQDRMRGVWVCTLDNGVFYRPFRSGVEVQKPGAKKAVNALTGNGQTIFVSYVDSVAQIMDGTSLQPKSAHTTSTPVVAALWDREKSQYACSGHKFYGDLLTGKKAQYLRLRTEASRCMTELDGRITLASARGLFIWTSYPDSLLYEAPLSNSTETRWCSSVFQDSEGLIWAGSAKGVLQFDLANVAFQDLEEEHWKVRVTDIQEWRPGLLCMATRGKGLLLYSKETKAVQYIGQSNGLSSNSLYDLTVDASGVLWVSSLNGLDALQLDSNQKPGLVGHWNTTVLGGPFDQTYFQNGRLWIGGLAGLHAVESKELLRKMKLPSVQMTAVKVNGEILEDRNRLQNLEATENDIEIELDYAFLPERERLILSYRLRDGEEWRPLTDGRIRLEALAPGAYAIQVSASLARNAKQIPVFSQTINIQFPFWQQPWFVILACLLSASLVSFVVFQRQQRRLVTERQANIQEREVRELKLKALKAQMNPHFIFNAMTSIQYFIGEKQSEKAERFVGYFAKLIRVVLDHSEKNWVSLKSELQMIQTLVDLESMRLDEPAIQFETKVSGLDPQKTQFPPALFQPYIENAIWHGLQTKEGARAIRFSATLEGGKVQVEIEDNGIGRAQSNKQNGGRREYRSFGMLIASRRISAVNQEQLVEPVEIIDLTDANGQPCGTKVVFTIPHEEVG